MPTDFVVTKAVSSEHVIARVSDSLLWRALTEAKSGQCHEWFEGGAWRVKPRQGTIVQGAVGRIVQCLPVNRIDTIDKQVRIEAGLGHKGQYSAGRRLDGDQGATPRTEGFFGDFL